jgi:hypothetical protein
MENLHEKFMDEKVTRGLLLALSSCKIKPSITANPSRGGDAKPWVCPPDAYK